MAEPFISGRGVSFRLFGFPVLYKWTALAIPAFFGFPLISRAESVIEAVEVVLALGLAIGAAVLIHELGHAVTARAFGGTARIELVLLGGLTHHSYTKPLSNGRKALVSVAGTGFGVAAAIPVAVAFNQAVTSPSTIWELALSWFVIAAGVWGLFNLIPLPGLDGSHILDAGVRAVSPARAGVIVPVITTVTAVAAIAGMYVWRGAFAAVWLLIIFGPELVNVGERIRRGRDEPLLDAAIAAEEAYRRGDLQTALEGAEAVLAQAGSDEIVAAMVNVRRASLARLGRVEELLALEQQLGSDHVLPPLMRARALASRGRYAEAEATARQLGPLPEAVALVAELLVAQDLDHRVGEILTAEAIPVLSHRIADLEAISPDVACRLAQQVAESSVSPSLDLALAHGVLGTEPHLNGLAPDETWLVALERAARTGDATGFEHAVTSVPSQELARTAQRRLHAIGRFDHAARLGSALEPDPASRVVLARSFARIGDTDQAMRALETAVAAGWSDAPDVATNPDLISLHSLPGWRRLLERMAEQAP
jgi:Zn-dependent protease